MTSASTFDMLVTPGEVVGPANWTWANPVTLNANDPFERVLMEIVETNRRKRKDYAVDGSPFSNFDYTAGAMGIPGFGAREAAEFNGHQKDARLSSLRTNGRIDDPENESVQDTFLDRAVYAVITYAIHRYPDGKVPVSA